MKNIVRNLEKNSVLIDTNVLLRYFLEENETLYNLASEAIDLNDCYVLPNILQECIYVLEGKIYKIPREEIVMMIRNSFDVISYINKEIIDYALEVYKNNHKLDFVDCLLYVYHNKYNLNVFSFDKDLNNILYN